MPGGAYLALSGVKTRVAQLDRIAADLANATTAGYKGERTSTVSAPRDGDLFGRALDAAIDVTDGPVKVDFRPGPLTATGRDLDVAVDGDGFFEIETPNGPRYTRNGHFTRSPEGMLATIDGSPVAGEGGPIELPPNETVIFDTDGTVHVGAKIVGQIKLVDFADKSRLTREGGSMFVAPDDLEPTPLDEPVLRGGALEGSNVSVVESMVRLVEVSRTFDTLQKGIGTVMNDLDQRAITEYGRK
ncbi:MAG: flagellar basal-body rod protein FlgF [Vicinamibacterales bacterium]